MLIDGSEFNERAEEITIMQQMCLTQRVLLITALISTVAVFPGRVFGADSEAADEWELGAELYMWGADLTGSTPTGSPVLIPFEDILDNLELAFMGTFAARKDRWGFLMDVIYMDISDDQGFSLANGTITGKSTVDMDALIITPLVTYKVVEDDRYTVSLGLGARYIDTNIKLTFDPDNASATKIRDDFDSTDAIVAARGVYNLNERWNVVAFGDVGTGDSDSTWQLKGSVGYQFSNWTLRVGYRYLKWEFDEDDNEILSDLEIKGPYLGAVFLF